jgi:Protein of unknown function (DUF4238)
VSLNVSRPESKLNQHFISRFLIENFVDESAPGNRGVWVYRASHEKWSKRPTRTTGALEDFYTLIEKNGDRDYTLEDFMERIETQVAPIIRDGIEAGRRLSPPQPYDAFVCFCALLICRSPGTFERVKRSLVRQILDEMKLDFADQESFQRFRSEFKEHTATDFPNLVDPAKVLSNFQVSATKEGGIGFSMLMLQPLNEQLGRLHVRFLRSPSGRTFITSDCPYVIGTSQPGLIEQLLVPLSPRTCAMFYPGAEPKYDYLDVQERDVDFVNYSVLGAAQEFLIAFSPDAVPEELITEWSAATPGQRERLVSRLGG